MNKYNIKINKQVIEQIFKALNVTFSDDIFDHDVYVANEIEVEKMFFELLSKYEYPLTSEKTINNTKIDIRKFISSKTIQNIGSCIGDVRISSIWYKQFKELFDSAILEILPRIKEHDNIYPPIKQLFNWTFFTEPQNIKLIFLGQDPYVPIKRELFSNISNMLFATNTDNQHSPSLETIFNKMNYQLQNKYSFNTWFNNGNFYQYCNKVLSINVGLTISYDKKTISHFKFWKTFIKKLIMNITHTNKNITIICFGTQTKNLVQDIENIKIICDIDPLIKNKPHNYNSTPDYFYTFRDIFNV